MAYEYFDIHLIIMLLIVINLLQRIFFFFRKKFQRIFEMKKKQNIGYAMLNLRSEQVVLGITDPSPIRIYVQVCAGIRCSPFHTNSFTLSRYVETRLNVTRRILVRFSNLNSQKKKKMNLKK